MTKEKDFENHFNNNANILIITEKIEKKLIQKLF